MAALKPGVVASVFFGHRLDSPSGVAVSRVGGEPSDAPGRQEAEGAEAPERVVGAWIRGELL